VVTIGVVDRTYWSRILNGGRVANRTAHRGILCFEDGSISAFEGRIRYPWLARRRGHLMNAHLYLPENVVSRIASLQEERIDFHDLTSIVFLNPSFTARVVTSEGGKTFQVEELRKKVDSWCLRWIQDAQERKDFRRDMAAAKTFDEVFGLVVSAGFKDLDHGNCRQAFRANSSDISRPFRPPHGVAIYTRPTLSALGADRSGLR
jgi:hypothetical protein